MHCLHCSSCWFSDGSYSECGTTNGGLGWLESEDEEKVYQKDTSSEEDPSMYEEDSFMKEDSSMDEEDPMMALEKMEEDSSQDFSKGDC